MIMNSKYELNRVESRILLAAPLFRKLLTSNQIPQCKALMGSLGVAVANFINAPEARRSLAVRDEINLALNHIQAVQDALRSRKVDAALSAYGNFVRYVPRAHARLHSACDCDQNSWARGIDINDVALAPASETAIAALSLS